MASPALAIPTRCGGACLATLALALLALSAVVTALWHLSSASDELVVRHARSGTVPVTLYRPASAELAPAVVIAHGFAGSQQLMQPYALTLARNGYLVVTFDFAGHGRNAEPFVANLMDQDKRLRVLLDALEPAIDFALAQPESDGRLALIGHSMAGDVLARYTQAHSERVGAMVLISPYLSESTQTADLRNLLLIYGALEPEMLRQQGQTLLAEADGNRRALVLADGVEHIGVLYSGTGLDAARDWLDQSFERTGSGFVDQRGPWLGLFYLGLIVLAWPLSRLLPRVSVRAAGAGLSWRYLLPVAFAPAVLTPLILWKLPSDFLPILIGDYLALHFALYGLITGAGLWLMRRATPTLSAKPLVRDFNLGRFVLAASAVTLYVALAFGVPTDRFVTSLAPGAERVVILAVMLAGTLSYFVADEWLTRGEGAARGGYALTKLLFLLSLLLAVGLNLQELFFLIIIVPAILLLFVVYGLMSGWVNARTGHPLVGATANAVVFALATSVTFPLVGA